MAKSVNKIRTSGLELWTLRSWSSPSFLSKNSKLWGSQRSPCQLPVALKVASLCELSELGHTSRPSPGTWTVLICLLAPWASPFSEFLFIWSHDTYKVQSAAKLFETQQVPKVLWPVEDLRRLTERKKEKSVRQAGTRGKPCPWSLWRARTESSRSRWPQTSSGCPRAQKGGADSSSHSSPLAHLPLPLRVVNYLLYTSSTQAEMSLLINSRV